MTLYNPLRIRVWTIYRDGAGPIFSPKCCVAMICCVWPSSGPWRLEWEVWERRLGLFRLRPIPGLTFLGLAGLTGDGRSIFAGWICVTDSALVRANICPRPSVNSVLSPPMVASQHPKYPSTPLATSAAIPNTILWMYGPSTSQLLSTQRGLCWPIWAPANPMNIGTLSKWSMYCSNHHRQVPRQRGSTPLYLWITLRTTGYNCNEDSCSPV